MRLARLLGVIPLLVAALTDAPALAQKPPTLDDEAQEIAARLEADEPTERAYGAMAVLAIARREARFALVDRPALQPWQRALGRAIPQLVEQLADDAPLQWVDMNDKPMSDVVTTPAASARLALVALERAAIEPLVAALDRPELTKQAAGTLRQIVGDGPAQDTGAAWRAWWREHQGRPLTNERGHLGLVIGLVVAIGAAVAIVVWRQRVRERRETGHRGLFAAAGAAAAVPAAAVPAAPGPAEAGGGDEA